MFGGIKNSIHRFTHRNRAQDTAPAGTGSSFNVINQPGSQAGAPPTVPARQTTPQPHGWTIPGRTAGRAGSESPENLQQVQYYGGSSSESLPNRPLRATNASTPSPPTSRESTRGFGQPSPPSTSESAQGFNAAPYGYPHPDSLVPGRMPAAPMALTPDLSFETPIRHPDALIPGRGTGAPAPLGPDLTFQPPDTFGGFLPGRGTENHSAPNLGMGDPAFHGGSRASLPNPRVRGRQPQVGTEGYQTFAQMGFVQVKPRFKLTSPSTWLKREPRIMHMDQVDPARHKLMTFPNTTRVSLGSE